MSNFTRNLRERGFTLVELLIVVIILSILAAIVVPQFANSTTDAKESALDANLGAMRSAIELYRAQHGAYPGAVTAAGAAACVAPGVAGTGIATAGTGETASQALMDQLSMYSNAVGQTCSVNVAGAFRFGPYLRKGIPNDPIASKGALLADIRTVGVGTPLAATGAGGWAYDTISGQIIMDMVGNDSRGTAYALH